MKNKHVAVKQMDQKSTNEIVHNNKAKNYSIYLILNVDYILKKLKYKEL